MVRIIGVIAIALIVAGLLVGSLGNGIIVAYAAHGDLGAVLDTLEFDTADGAYPFQFSVSSGVAGCAYQSTDGDGWVKTYTVAATGLIGNSPIDSLEFDAADCQGRPWVCQIPGTIYYAIAYQGVDGDGWLCTVDIATNGQIGAAVTDSHEFDATSGRDPSLVHLSGDVFGLCYSDADNTDGILKTIDINSDGTIDASPELDSWIWDSTGIRYPNLRDVSGTTYAMGYLVDDTSEALKVSTVTIADNGTITEALIETLTVVAGAGADIGDIPYFDLCGGTVFAMSYENTNDGYPYIETMTISSGGDISNATVDTQQLDSSVQMSWGSFVMMPSEDVIVSSFGGGSSDECRAYTVDVDTSGNLGSVLDTLVIDDTYGDYASVLRAFDGIFVVDYMGMDGDGYARSFDVSYVSITLSPASFGFGDVGPSETVPVGTYGHFDTVVDTLEFDTSDFNDRASSMCEVSDTIVAIAYPPTVASVVLKTFDVDSSGNLGSVIDSLTMWSGSSSRWPMIIEHPGDSTTFLVFGLSDQDPYVATATIDSSGNIDNAVVDSHTFGTPLLDSDWFLDVCHVSGDIFALVCDGADGDGYLTTIDVNSDGTIDAVPQVDQWEFDDVGCSGPSIIHVTGDWYAIYYQDSASYMKIFTTDINTDGTMVKTKQENLTVVTTDTIYGNIVLYSGSIFVMSSTNSGANSILETCTIDASGDITLVDEQLLPIGSANHGNLQVVGDSILCFYRNGTSDGRAISYSIDSFGNFRDPLDRITWLGSQPDWMYRSALAVSDTVCLIAYQGADDDGFVTSVSLEYGAIEDYFKISNTGSVSCDVTIQGTDMTGGGETWTLSDTATPGSGIYGLKAGLQGFKELDDYEWEATQAIYLDACAVASGVIVAVYQDSSNNGGICTLTVGADGSLGTVVDSLLFETGGAFLRPCLAKYSGQNTYACFYEATAADIKVQTFTIDADGDNITAVDTHIIADIGIRPTAFQRSGDTFVVSYVDGDNDGWLVTMDINSDGSIDESPMLDSWEYADTSEIKYPRILSVSGDYFGVLYGDSDLGDLLLFSTTSTDAGVLGDTKVDTLTVDNSYSGIGYPASFGYVRGDVFVTAHQGDDNDGWMDSFTIDSSGNISSKLDQVEFDTNYCTYTCVLGDGSSSVLLAYVGHDGDYFSGLKKYDVSAAGEFTDSGYFWKFDADGGSYLGKGSLIETRTDIYAAIYTGAGVDGWIKSFEVYPGYDTVIKKGSPFNNLVLNVYAGETAYWGMQLLTPTGGLAGNEVSGTLTLTATQHT